MTCDICETKLGTEVVVVEGVCVAELCTAVWRGVIVDDGGELDACDVAVVDEVEDDSLIDINGETACI